MLFGGCFGWCFFDRRFFLLHRSSFRFRLWFFDGCPIGNMCLWRASDDSFGLFDLPHRVHAHPLCTSFPSFFFAQGCCLIATPQHNIKLLLLLFAHTHVEERGTRTLTRRARTISACIVSRVVTYRPDFNSSCFPLSSAVAKLESWLPLMPSPSVGGGRGGVMQAQF